MTLGGDRGQIMQGSEGGAKESGFYLFDVFIHTFSECEMPPVHQALD